jgi:hypothetical protein
VGKHEYGRAWPSRRKAGILCDAPARPERQPQSCLPLDKYDGAMHILLATTKWHNPESDPVLTGSMSRWPPDGALFPVANLRQQIELNLLDLREAIPLMRKQVIDLVVKVPDLELGLEIHLVVVL